MRADFHLFDQYSYTHQGKPVCNAESLLKKLCCMLPLTQLPSVFLSSCYQRLPSHELTTQSIGQTAVFIVMHRAGNMVDSGMRSDAGQLLQRIDHARQRHCLILQESRHLHFHSARSMAPETGV